MLKYLLDFLALSLVMPSFGAEVFLKAGEGCSLFTPEESRKNIPAFIYSTINFRSKRG